MDALLAHPPTVVIRRTILRSFFSCSKCENQIDLQLSPKNAKILIYLKNHHKISQNNNIPYQFHGISLKLHHISQAVGRLKHIQFQTTYTAFHSDFPSPIRPLV